MFRELTDSELDNWQIATMEGVEEGNPRLVWKTPRELGGKWVADILGQPVRVCDDVPTQEAADVD